MPVPLSAGKLCFSIAIMIVAAGGLSACGGNAASTAPATVPPAVPPAPPPAPPPPPPPAPPPSGVSQGEINAQPGLAQINILPAFNNDVFGEGALISIIDTGIDVNNPEFAGRIDPGSADLAVAPFVNPDDARAGGPSLQDTQGHGTSVASIAAAAANGQGIVGVAPEATILAFRGNLDDDPDTQDENESLTILGGAISEGVRRSVAADADVINLSLGSDEDGSLSGFIGIVQFAGSNDVVTILSAGNDGPDSGQPQGSAQAAASVEAMGTAIAVGAVDANNNITSFSNIAGDSAEFFIVAPGLFIPTVEIGGGLRPFSGTSASAPHVAGAVALIRGLWPQLNAAETVEIILDSATDLGAPGTDPVFGRGLLNVGAALQPSGQLSVATANGQSVPASSLSNVLSGAFGSSSFDIPPVVGLDRFGRDFAVTLDGLNARTDSARFAVGGAVSPFRTVKSEREPLATGGALTIRLSETDPRQDPAQATFFRDLSGETVENAAARDFAISFTQPLGPEKSQLIIAQGFSPREVDTFTSFGSHLQTLSRSAFSDAYLPDSIDSFTGLIAFQGPFAGQIDLLVNSAFQNEIGFAADPFLAQQAGRGEAVTSTFRLGYTTRQLGGAAVRLETGFQSEPETVLGSQFGSGLFGSEQGAETIYTSVATQVALHPRVSLLGRYSLGRTQLNGQDQTGLIVGSDALTSTQFSLGLQTSGLFRKTDRFSISLSQPLQVTGGGLTLSLPTSFDQVTETIGFSEIETAFGGALPLDLEAGYAVQNIGGFSLLLNAAVGLSGFGAGETAFALRAQKRF